MFGSRTFIRVLVGFCAAAALVVGPTIPAASAQPVTPNALTTQVVTGDTFTTFSIQRGWVHVRVFGIDAAKPGQCFGDEATAFAASSLTWQPMLLEADPRWPSADPTGVTTLAHIIRMDGFNYAVEAARAGIARAVYVGQFRDAVRAAEQEAKDAQRGIWSENCNFGA